MNVFRFPLWRSRPARGAWVEIRSERDVLPLHHRRAPQGARGLKCKFMYQGYGDSTSRPARGAWVEIFLKRVYSEFEVCRAPQGARGLK